MCCHGLDCQDQKNNSFNPWGAILALATVASTSMHANVNWLLTTLRSTYQIHLFMQTFIHWWQRLGARCQPTQQEQFGFQYFVQGCLDMQPGESGIRARDLPITGRPTACACVCTKLTNYNFYTGLHLIYTDVKKVEAKNWKNNGKQELAGKPSCVSVQPTKNSVSISVHRTGGA